MFKNEKKTFWVNLEKIRRVLGQDERSFSTFLDLGFSEFLNFRSREEFLPINNIVEFCFRFNINQNDLLKESFDPLSLLNALAKEVDVDERYKVAAYSSTILIKNTLNFVEQKLGVGVKADIMKGFKITPALLEQHERRVNILLNKDIVSYLRASFRFTDADFIEMGQSAVRTLKGTSIEKGILQQRSIGEMLEQFILESSSAFDLNYRYCIQKLNSDFVVIEAVPRKEVLEEIGLPATKFGNEALCNNRMGVMSTVSSFAFGKHAEISCVSSTFAGDKSTCYVMDLAPFKKASPVAELV